MPIGPTHKRMCNPCGIPDAKFFKDGRKGSGEPKRDKPLEGLKLTRQVEVCEGFNKLVLGSQTERRDPSPHARPVGLMTYVLGLIFWLAVFIGVATDSGLAGLIAMLSFFGIHWCVIFSRVLSRGACRLGIVGLACFWASVLLVVPILLNL